MTQKSATIERLATFSDSVFAVIMTIMVLDLMPPKSPTFGALAPLWPTFLSYIVSYVFIAIVWVNHHHLFHFARTPNQRLIWINFAHLFLVSLVPFTTAWVAITRMASVPVLVYASVFLLIEVIYFQFERHALAHAVAEFSHKTRRLVQVRSFIALTLFVLAILTSMKLPMVAFVLVCCGVLLYFRPDTGDSRETIHVTGHAQPQEKRE